MHTNKIRKEKLTRYISNSLSFLPVILFSFIEIAELNSVGFLYVLYSLLVGMLIYYLVLFLGLDLESFFKNPKKESLTLKRIATFAMSSYVVVLSYSIGSDTLKAQDLIAGHLLCGAILISYISTIVFFEVQRKRVNKCFQRSAPVKNPKVKGAC